MNIRPLTPEDAGAWWSLRLEALEHEPHAFGSSPEEHRAITVADIANRFREYPSGDCTFGAFDSSSLVAIATLIRERNLKERHKAHIYGVYVAASHRGQGVGRDLLQALILRARSIDGLEQLHLAVRTGGGPASRLYQRLGFTPYGTEPHGLKLGATYVDEDLLLLRLG